MRPYYHSALHLLLINLANDGTRNYVLSWINVKRSLRYKLKIFYPYIFTTSWCRPLVFQIHNS